MEFLFALENNIYLWLHGLANQSTAVDWAVIFFARYAIYLFLVIFLWKAMVQREPYERLELLLVGILSVLVSCGLISLVLDFAVQRPAPSGVQEFTNLIGQTTFIPFVPTLVFTLAAVTLARMRKATGVGFFTVSILIGMSYTIAGVSRPLDILSSFFIGVLTANLIHLVIPKTAEIRVGP